MSFLSMMFPRRMSNKLKELIDIYQTKGEKAAKSHIDSLSAKEREILANEITLIAMDIVEQATINVLLSIMEAGQVTKGFSGN